MHDHSKAGMWTRRFGRVMPHRGETWEVLADEELLTCQPDGVAYGAAPLPALNRDRKQFAVWLS